MPKTNWTWVILGGLLAGVVINAGELALHRVILHERWTAAFTALGKHPTGWAMFIPANFLVGPFTVWLYTRMRLRYGPGPQAAVRAGLAIWAIFWVIPMLALVPLELFPNWLLFLVIAGGVVNANLAALLGAWAYRAVSSECCPCVSLGMTPFAEGIWVEIGPVRILGMRLTTTMTVLRLPDGSLLLHSPLPLTPERRAAVEALGPVAHLYAPSRYHDLRIGEWAAAFPSARLHAPSGLVKERSDVRIDRVIGSAPEPAFLGVIDELTIEGFRLEETVLIYRPTRTLVVADLVHNVGRPQDWWTRVYTKLMGFYDRVALSRAIRWAAFSDRAAARRSIDELLTRPFDSLIVGHGRPLTTGGREAIANAFTWLRD